MTRRVLVVEDHELWRQRICAELDRSARYHVVAELADGAEAVDAAQALKPDVILLDIGLQTFNGIEAARRILADEPEARILFLTAQRSTDVAIAALSTGARGYLLKTEAAGKVPLAVDTVFDGGWFISAGLPPEVLDVTRRTPAESWRHDAVFHSDEPSLVDDFARFAEESLDAGKVVVAITDTDRLARLRARLESRNVSTARAIAEDRYVEVDVVPELARLMRGDITEDEERRRSAEFLMDVSTRTGERRRVAICGAVSHPLWRAGYTEAAIHLERAWDSSVQSFGADLFCGFLVDRSGLPANDHATFRQLCGCHQMLHVR